MDLLDMETLAQALEQKFPQTDLSVLEHSALEEMLSSLKEVKDVLFDENKSADLKTLSYTPDEMETLINVWIGVQFPEEAEKVPSSQID